MPTSRKIGFSEALSAGFGLARRAPGVVAFAWVGECASVVLGLALQVVFAALALRAAFDGLATQPAVFFGEPIDLQRFSLPAPTLPLAGAAIASGVLVLVLRLVWLSAGARVFGLRLAGEEVPFTVGRIVERLAPATLVGLLFVPIYLSAWLFGATAIGASGLAYARALGTGRGGFAGALALALALLLAFVVTKAVEVLFRLTMVRAVAGDEGPVRALAAAARLGLERLGAFAGLMVVFGFLQGIAAFVAGAGSLMPAGEGKAALLIPIAGSLLTGLIGAALFAWLATIELGAFTAIDAGARGVLPEPPPQEPAPQEPPLPTELLVESEPILSTEVICGTEPV
ncbi:MAG: hypothetical protein ACOX6T_14350 [Myxococcales bacterium]